MPYTPTSWQDYPDTSTPINATRLNNMETGIDAAIDHVDDTTAAHQASAIAFTPTGTIAATDVQNAIAEVASEAAAAAPIALIIALGS